MLRLYDNNLLSDYDKANLKIQEAAYLNAAFALEQPIPEIMPRKIYRYSVDKNNVSLRDSGILILESYVVNRLFDKLDYNKDTQDYSHLWPLFIDVNRDLFIPTRYFIYKGADYKLVSSKQSDKILNLNDKSYHIPVEIIGASSCLTFSPEKIAYLPLIEDSQENSMYYYSTLMNDPVEALNKVFQQVDSLKKQGYTTLTIKV